MDRGIWQATVHGVAKSWTWLSNLTQVLQKFTEQMWPLSHFGLRLESWERCDHSVSSLFTCLVQGVAPAVVYWVGHLPYRCHSPPSGEGAGFDRTTAFCSLQSRFRAGGQRQDARCPGSGGQRGRTRDTSILPKPKQSHGKESVTGIVVMWWPVL